MSWIIFYFQPLSKQWGGQPGMPSRLGSPAAAVSSKMRVNCDSSPWITTPSNQWDNISNRGNFSIIIIKPNFSLCAWEPSWLLSQQHRGHLFASRPKRPWMSSLLQVEQRSLLHLDERHQHLLLQEFWRWQGQFWCGHLRGCARVRGRWVTTA